MTDADYSDIFDSAFSADALHKAAEEGELAARTLIALSGWLDSDLATIVREKMRPPPPPDIEPDFVRRLAATFLCHEALGAGRNPPPRKTRQAARRFLNSPEANSLETLAGAIKQAGLLPKEHMTLLDVAEKIAREVLIQVPGAELAPTWFLEREGEDTVMVFETPWSNDEAKAEILDQMREIMRKEGVTRYVFASESWVSTDLTSTVRPRDSDTRIEIVNAVTSEGDGKFWTIVRDRAGVVTELEPLRTAHGIAGRMRNLLDHAPDGPPLKFGDGPLTLNFVGRVHVVSPDPEVITLFGNRVTVTPSTEIETLFVAGAMSEDADLLSYEKLCAVNGLKVAFASFGVALRVGLTARVALFEDGGQASFPVLLLEDGRIICWCSSEQTAEDMHKARLPRPTDRPARAEEMKALIESYSERLQ
jgi:hypothetical protein